MLFTVEWTISVEQIDRKERSKLTALGWDEINANALAFSKRWKDANNEEAQSQAFQMDFFRVFGLTDY